MWKNSEGQDPVVGMSLADSRDRSEASVAGAEQGKLRNWVRKTLSGPMHMGRWRLRAGRTQALSHPSNQSQIQPQLTSDKVEGPVWGEGAHSRADEEHPLGSLAQLPGKNIGEGAFGNVAHSSTFIYDSSGCCPHRRVRGR